MKRSCSQICESKSRKYKPTHSNPNVIISNNHNHSHIYNILNQKQNQSQINPSFYKSSNSRPFQNSTKSQGFYLYNKSKYKNFL